MISKLTYNDIDQVASLHKQELPGFLSELGERFLKKFYKISLNNPEMFTFVEKQENQVMGFVTGVENTSGLYKKIILADPMEFGLLLSSHFITHPFNILKLLKTLTYPGFSGNNSELLTIAVAKSQQRQGIGRKLFMRVAEEFKKRGINKFLISVYDRLLANEFYEKVGCQFEKSFTFLGEEMNYYSYNMPLSLDAQKKVAQRKSTQW